MAMGDAYVIVYSVTDKGSFEKASELRIQLRRARQADDVPIILVGNKSDLVRSREVSLDGELSSGPEGREILFGLWALGIFCGSKCSIRDLRGEVCLGAASPHQGSQRSVMLEGGLDPGLLGLSRSSSG